MRRCFYGSCYYYCDHSWAICGRPHTFEASVCAMLPFTRWTHRSFMSPWRRAYHRDRRAPWELPGANDTWCPRMLRNASLWDLHHNDARWLDMVDVALLDFLIGNVRPPVHRPNLLVLPCTCLIDRKDLHIS